MEDENYIESKIQAVTLAKKYSDLITDIVESHEAGCRIDYSSSFAITIMVKEKWLIESLNDMLFGRLQLYLLDHELHIHADEIMLGIDIFVED